MRRREFERMVARLVDELPEPFAGRLDNLVFLVEDHADKDLLAEFGYEHPDELLGTFFGTPLSERTFDLVEDGPCRIVLFQQAIENEARATGLSVRRVARETLWHEIAHYFGFTEEEMDTVERQWAQED
ncbi:MAG: metallopeptidase family protein [Geothermobacteraceae bacterium]